MSHPKAAIMFIVITVLLSGCDSGSPAPNSSDLLRQGVENMQKLKSYHIEEKGFVGSVQVTLSGDFDVANKRYSSSETYLADGSNQQAYDLIIVGSDRYIRDRGAGKAVFVKDASGSNDLATNTLSGLWANIQASALTTATTSLKEQGSESIGGVAARHIAIPSTALAGLNFLAAGTDPNFDIELWISTDGTPRILQMQLKGNLQQSGAGKFDLLLNWSHFDAPLTIEPPA